MAEYKFSATARFRKGARTSAEVAQVVGDHLDLLRQQNDGKLDPVQVVEDARNPNSPLNGYFDWDDSEAARLYRLQQARGLIRSVVAIYRTSPDSGPKSIRAFVSVTTGDDAKPSYVASAVAMSDEDMRAKTLRKAWDEAQRFRQRYAELTEFASLFATIDELEAVLPPVATAA